MRTEAEIRDIITEEHVAWLDNPRPATCIADTWWGKAAKRIADQPTAQVGALSEYEIVRAMAKAMRDKDPVPLSMFTHDELCDIAKATLAAIAAALVAFRIAGLRDAQALLPHDDDAASDAARRERDRMHAAIEARIAELTAPPAEKDGLK